MMTQPSSSISLSRSERSHRTPLLLAALVVVVVGCGTSLPTEEVLDTQSAALRGRNGMTPNGLATNGLATNGLATNGLATNGLATNGLVTDSFSTWFSSNPASYSNMVMKYVVSCAYAQGTSLIYKDPATLTTYTWTGLLGLTPGWASGLPITLDEQQLITACLAAHVNKFGVNMDISIRGVTATGSLLSLTRSESTEFSEKEAAFFGNIFTGEGVFACNDRYLNRSESSARACGLASQSQGASVECPPMQHIGGCTQPCILDKNKAYYVSCTINGRTYKPLTTRIKPSDIYRCGDGVCQITESCDPDLRGTGSTYDACEADCGNCAQ